MREERVAAVTVQDCALRLRIAYVLPRPLAFEDLEEVIEGEVRIDAFSQLSDNAMDHFRMSLVGGARATGVVDGRTLIVTYGKLGSHEPTIPARGRLEDTLTLRYGRIVIAKSLEEGAAIAGIRAGPPGGPSAPVERAGIEP
ncbi:MAG TPA: hypothetical protein ENK18_26950 [Deltaproteobacteria bacterium]|nr:hypothetical protein [Deltaproteobacteria bacterium]